MTTELDNVEEMEMARRTGSHDAVESAIDASKGDLTWEGFAKSGRITPWAQAEETNA